MVITVELSLSTCFELLVCHMVGFKRKNSSERDKLITNGVDNGYGALDTDKAKNPLEFEKSRAKVKPEKPSAALYALFRYATVSDLCLILLGSVCAVINGVGFPLMSLVLGGMSDAFIAAQNSDFAKNNRGRNTSSLFVFNNSIPQYVLPTLSANEFESQVAQFALYYVYIGFIIMVTSYLQVACWTSACERQMNQLRRRFFHGILRQNIGWFDEQKTGEFTTKLADDLERVKEGIGDKLGLMIQYAATFIAGFVIAFAESWKMTLVMMSLTPFIAISSGFIGKFIAQSSRKEQQSYAVAGGIADEVISCIRTVLVFNGQHKEAERYENALKEGQKLGIRKQLLAGLALFFLFVILFGTYALAFWYGSVMITEGDITPGTVFIVFFSVMSGSFSIGNVAPQIPIVATAKAAAAGLFEVIDRIPSIDSYSKSGKEPSKVVSRVEFKNVHFTYPTRQNVKILNGISFDVEPGKTVAIVGPSGCGKSTILQLLLRFYDIEGGQILVSGEEVQNLNLKWLRSTIAAVTQEPNLFDASVTENIRLGRKDASLEEIEKVCKMANAHNFIVGLPNGYETIVGERGTQLSGGQKQRIAIARALIRNPQILLLDEATSALDAESEGIVQQALDKAKEGRTTIVIAHRLSTIRNADKIVAMDAGEVVEVGTHAELMANRRLYYDLVSNQTFETLQPPPIEEITNEADFAAQPHFQDGTTVLDDIAELNMKRRHLSQQMSTVSIRSGHSEKSNASRKPLTRAISMGKPKDDKERLIEELKEENVKKTNLAEISKVAKTEWGYMAIGFIGAAVRGAVMPAFSFFFSEIFNVYSKTGQELLDGATFWALMFLVLGFANGTACLAASYYFGLTGEKLTMRLRSQVFRNILRQDAAYFDDGKRSTGKLCTRLATDAPNVKGAIDFRLTTLVASVISLIAGIVIAFIYGWKLALLILGIVPLLALASWINIKLRRLSDEGGAKLLENAGKVVSETISNIRTVQSLTREHTFYDNFCRHLEIPYRQALRQCQTHAIGYAFATSFIFFLYAASFRLGAFLAAIGDIQPLDVFKVFFAIAFCGMTAGWAAAYIPEYAKARMSGALIFKMLREIPHIDGTSQLGVKANISGAVTFKRVTFAYPTRPEIKVLNGLTFHVNPGQTVALVGQSGCGKSTVVSLLERLYDVKEGQILFDNFDIKTLNLPDLRNHISLVSQEPLLFDCSIWENIAYGLEPPVGHERIVAAAKAANIHDFIMTLPQGYNTEVGEKGTQLSGGQKQRVAIARAIIRDPKILLLDEATSALDTESEKIVQEALDEARKGRTCIIVAHRLSTIQSADNIIVMKGGKVIETGTHQELLAQKNVYFNLIQNQQVQE